MDKENGEGDAAAKPPPDGLLDPSGLFGGNYYQYSYCIHNSHCISSTDIAGLAEGA